jgi:hypothetical protein
MVAIIRIEDSCRPVDMIPASVQALEANVRQQRSLAETARDLAQVMAASRKE